MRKKFTCWGDVYNAALASGKDHGYAAHLADQWERRHNRKPKKEIKQQEAA